MANKGCHTKNTDKMLLFIYEQIKMARKRTRNLTRIKKWNKETAMKQVI